jgi:hypothetical protein
MGLAGGRSMPRLRLTLVISSLLLTLLVGSLGGYLWGHHRATAEMAVLNELAVSYFIASESGVNMEQYFIASPEVAAYALHRNISLLESNLEVESLRKDKIALAWDITLSYARLGRLADKLGKKEEASEEYSRALQASEKTGRQFKSVQDLLLFVDKLDTQYREEMQNRKLSEKQ